MGRTLMGRDGELAVIGAAASSGAAWTVVIEGEAGIGKSALWEAALWALPSPARLLRTRSRAVETELAFAGLTDLLAPVPDTVLEALPEPQRDAVAAATLRAGGDGSATDGRAVGTAVRTLLTILGRDGPVVLALDDVQWLDPASRDALEFAVHRCDVGLLVAIRDPDGPVPVAGASAAPETRVPLGPLSLASLHHLILDRLGHAPTRPVLVRVAEVSRGNPLFALELARAAAAAPPAAASAVPTLPPSLMSAMSDRIGELSDDAQLTMLVTALAATPTVALLRSVDAVTGLDEAETAGVLDVRDGRVELRHPLLGAAAVDRAPAPVVRGAHASLAAALRDDEERSARHLALAATEPDEQVAAALDRAVKATRTRGAVAAAAELALLAVRHSTQSAPEVVAARTLTLATLAFENGDAEEAERLFWDVYRGHGDPDLRATAALELTDILWKRGRVDQCVEMARSAAGAGASPELTARAHLTLAVLGQERETNAAVAAKILDDAGVIDAQLRGWAQFQVVDNAFDAGRGLDVPALEAALVAERRGRAWRSDDQVATCRPALLKYADHLDAALVSLDELHAQARHEGNVGQLIYVVGHYPVLLLRLGDLAGAEAMTEEHLELAATTGQTNHLWQAQHNRAWVALHAGRLDEAGAAVREMSRVVQPDAYSQRAYRAVAGALALLQGDGPRAAEHLDRWWRYCRQRRDDPGLSRGHGDYAEALVGLARYADCAAFLGRAEEVARRAGRTSVLALTARGRAVLCAAEGDLEGAVASVDQAIALDSEVPIAVEGARHLLLKGQLHRRAKEKRQARAALEEAEAGFVEVGADWWAERARAELARVNIKPGATTDLTPSEQRIAELAGRGLTTRQIADAAFVSPKTVEANLTRIYRKLGIRSRAELGQRFGQLHVEGSP